MWLGSSVNLVLMCFLVLLGERAEIATHLLQEVQGAQGSQSHAVQEIQGKARVPG